MPVRPVFRRRAPGPTTLGAVCDVVCAVLSPTTFPCTSDRSDQPTARHDWEVSIMRHVPPTKYLYIVGRGHSGTTIFSMLSGEARSVASEGETIMGFRPGFEGKSCANGETFSDSSFWQAVQTGFEERTGRPFAEGVGVLYRRAHVKNTLAMLLSGSGSAETSEAKMLMQALY